MAEKVLMLALSPTMEEGIVARWLKKEGDRVEVGDVICEVETDKATMDYESMSEGILLKILKEEGSSAAIGETIAIIGEEGENIDHLLEGEGNRDKSDVDAPAPKSEAAVPADRPEASDRGRENFDSENKTSRIKASPLARRIAEMNNISLEDISGSGPDGRIVKADVETYLAETSPAKRALGDASAASGKAAVKQPDIKTGPAAVTNYGDIEIPVSAKRRIIAERLAESKYSAPHYYLTVTVAVDNLIQTRKKVNESQPEKVSFNAFLIKFAAEALKKHPMVNASWLGDRILVRKQADIGLAVAQDDGLITPVVHDCGNKGLIAIDRELKPLIERARNNQLMPEEYQNASFTISNLGSFGIEEFTAVINPPGSAILAVGEMKKAPAVGQEGNITVQTQMKLTLSCDHRVIDGAVGAAFLKGLKDIIEDPFKALL